MKDKVSLMILSSSNYPLLIIFVISIIFFNLPYTTMAQQSQGLINWSELCENPLVDALIAEPCHSLTTPDGYTLTKEGERVLGRLGGGTLAMVTGVPQLTLMGELIGCGSGSSSSSTDYLSSTSSYSNKNDWSSELPPIPPESTPDLSSELPPIPPETSTGSETHIPQVSNLSSIENNTMIQETGSALATSANEIKVPFNQTMLDNVQPQGTAQIEKQINETKLDETELSENQNETNSNNNKLPDFEIFDF